MADWLGDYPEDHTTVTCMFTTNQASGATVAPLTGFETADFKIFKNGSATEKTSTNGLTCTSAFNGSVGLHCLVIDTSNDTADSGFWTTGGGDVFTILLEPDTETVDGVLPIAVIGQFGINLSRALQPTTAGRKLDVTTTGGAGIDWGNVENLTTTNALTNTTIATTQKVDLETIKTQAVALGAGTLTFPTGATLASTTNITAGTLTTVTTATNVTTLNGIAADVITAASIATDAIGSAELAGTAANEIADALLDRSAGVETGVTVRQAMRLFASALLGKASGFGTTTVVYRDTGDSKDRITATVGTGTSSGNRTSVTLDAS